MRREGSVAVEATPSLVRWSAVFGGMVIGSGLLLLLGAMWSALAFETGIEPIQRGLGWFWAGSAIVALFVAGMLAGWLSGVPGVLTGVFNGLATWGLTVLVSVLAGVPSVLTAVGTGQAAVGFTLPAGALWAGFLALVVGAVAAGAGGAAGGHFTHPATVTMVPAPGEEREDAGRVPVPVRERPARDATAEPPARPSDDPPYPAGRSPAARRHDPERDDAEPPAADEPSPGGHERRS